MDWYDEAMLELDHALEKGDIDFEEYNEEVRLLNQEAQDFYGEDF